MMRKVVSVVVVANLLLATTIALLTTTTSTTRPSTNPVVLAMMMATGSSNRRRPLTNNNNNNNNNNYVPLCNCQQRAVQRTVRKIGPNQGRKFWGCKQWNSNKKEDMGCRFFEWVKDDEQQEEDKTKEEQEEKKGTTTTTPTAIATTTTGQQKQQQRQEHTTTTTMKLLTFNVAHFQRHSYAPITFDPQQEFAKMIDQLQPDIVALQELPTPYYSHPNYYCVGTAQSHCGYIALLVQNQFLQPQQQDEDEDEDEDEESSNNSVRMTQIPINMSLLQEHMMAPEPPVVMGSIRLPNNNNNNNNSYNQKQLVVISCHLEPYGEGDTIRRAQIAAITNALPTTTTNNKNKESESNVIAILAGDLNMRNKEGLIIEQQFHWKDAWKQTGSIRRNEYTWNSKINQYHGPNGFPFTCRFDRIYFKNCKTITSFELIAHQPKRTESNKKESYYLSDHFGIITTLVL